MNSKNIRGTASAFAKWGFSFAETAGIGKDEYAALTDVTLAEAQNPSARLNLDQHTRVSRVYWDKFATADGIAQTHVAGFLQSFPVFGALLLNSQSFVDAADNLIRYRGIIGDFDAVSIKGSDGLYEIEYVLEGKDRSVGCAMFNLVYFAQLARYYDPETSKIVSMELVDPIPRFAKAVGDVVQCRVATRQSRNKIVISAPTATNRFQYSNPVLHLHYLQKAADELEKLHCASSFARKVYAYLLDLYVGGRDIDHNLLIEYVCNRFGVSRWTLNRRLNLEGTSYERLVSEVRLDISKRLLCSSDLSIGVLSDMLGFSSPSAFTRFFSHHVARSPLAFRRDAQ